MNIDELIENAAAAAVVRPGDTLVLRMAADFVSRQQFDEYADTVRAAMGEKMKGVGLLLIAGADQMLVYRPDEVAARVDVSVNFPDDTDWDKLRATARRTIGKAAGR